MDMNRRSFVTSVALGAALSVVAPAYASIPRSTTDQLVARLKQGEKIRDETFILDKPLILDFKCGGEIHHCSFIGRPEKDQAVVTIEGDKTDIKISNISLVNHGSGYGFYINNFTCNSFFMGDF